MKYYAVKVGKTSGIFDNWSECNESIKGFPNAEFKSFPSREEAEAYLGNVDIWENKVKVDLEQGYVVSFCDGSYDDRLKRYSWGVLVIYDNFKESEICGYNSNPKYLSSRNVIGEILGVIHALDWAVSNGYSKIKIYHDYEGLEKWLSGEWKAESEAAKSFVSVYQSKYSDIVQVEFEKIKGHSNNKYNDRADELAKKALTDRKKLLVQGENWFTLPYFKDSELQAVIDLLREEHSDVQVEPTDTTVKTVYKLELYKDKLTITLFKSGNKKLLVQGANSLLLQMVVSFVSELLGIDKVEPILSDTYKISIDVSKISGCFNDLCPVLPSDYPENIKRLIKQSIINLQYYIKSEEYSQYAFPALRALEGHMKYIFNKSGIVVTKTFDMFDKNITNNEYVLKPTYGVANVNTKKKLEKYYNYYCATRHTIFHFGDIIGSTDATRMIETKEEADEIIKQCIKYICE